MRKETNININNKNKKGLKYNNTAKIKNKSIDNRYSEYFRSKNYI